MSQLLILGSSTIVINLEGVFHSITYVILILKTLASKHSAQSVESLSQSTEAL